MIIGTSTALLTRLDVRRTEVRSETATLAGLLEVRSLRLSEYLRYRDIWRDLADANRKGLLNSAVEAGFPLNERDDLVVGGDAEHDAPAEMADDRDIVLDPVSGLELVFQRLAEERNLVPELRLSDERPTLELLLTGDFDETSDCMTTCLHVATPFLEGFATETSDVKQSRLSYIG